MQRASFSYLLVFLSLLHIDCALGFLDFRPISVSRKTGPNRQRGTTQKIPILDFTGLVQRHGYPGEEYEVTTPDGYLVRLHRIPGSPTNPKAPGKPVVYLQHGILASSDSFVVVGPEHDLAFMLADAGYDVWLGNVRGNSYSRSHVHLSPEESEFWQFSWHEMAIYDVSTMIDFILQETQQRSLVYVAHSMGTTIGFVLLSSKPEFNEKISLVVNLATIGNWNKPRNLMRFFYNYGNFVQKFLSLIRVSEVLPQTLGGGRVLNGTCREGSFLQSFCKNMIYFVSGYDPELLDTKLLPFELQYYPAGTSTQTLLHYHQNIVSGKLQKYDHGYIRNYATYGQFTPPLYDLQSIETPVIMMVGIGDTVAAPEDSMELKRIIKHSRVEVVKHRLFNHLDFIWAKNIKPLLNDRIMEIIDNQVRRNVPFHSL